MPSLSTPRQEVAALMAAQNGVFEVGEVLFALLAQDGELDGGPMQAPEAGDGLAAALQRPVGDRLGHARVPWQARQFVYSVQMCVNLAGRCGRPAVDLP